MANAHNKSYQIVHNTQIKVVGGHHQYVKYLFNFLAKKSTCTFLFSKTSRSSAQSVLRNLYQLFNIPKSTSIYIFNGMWGVFTTLAFVLVFIFRKPYYIIPHGMASFLYSTETNSSKSCLVFFVKRQIALAMLLNAKKIIATSELENTKLISILDPPIDVFTIAPSSLYYPSWGVVDCPLKLKTRSNLYSSNFVVLAAGRFSKDKGFDVLLKTWSHFLDNYTSQAVLHLLGPLDDDSHALLANVPLKYLNTISFRDSEYTPEIFFEFASNSDCLISTSPSESFGMVIYEALALGLPAIVSSGTPWLNLDEYRAGHCVDHHYSNYSAKLMALYELSPDELASYSLNAKRLSFQLHKDSLRSLSIL